MGDLPNVFLYLVDEPERMSLRVLLSRADSVGDIVLIVLNEPNSVVSLEFLPFFVLESERFDFVKDLG